MGKLSRHQKGFEKFNREICKLVVTTKNALIEKNRIEVKEKLTEMVVNMSSFKKMAEKRKVNLEDLNEKNLKRKCSRRTTQKELFDDRWKEHFDQLYGYGQVEHLDQFHEWSEVDA